MIEPDRLPRQDVLYRRSYHPDVIGALREWFRMGFGAHTPASRKGDVLRWEFRQHPTSRAYLRVPTLRQDVIPRVLRGDVRSPSMGVDVVEWIACILDPATYQWFLGAPSGLMRETLDPEAMRAE